MAERNISIQQLDANAKWLTRTLSPAADRGTLSFDASGLPVASTAANTIADIGAFTDPPTAGEMATLRTTVNSILAALRTANVIKT